MLGKNIGYLNNNPDFCQVETKNILIAVSVLGWIGTKDIWTSVLIFAK